MFHRNQEGASALEFALVLPILILVLFGAISFGLAFNAKMQLSHAARESVRFAATLPVPADSDDWFKDVANRAIGTAAGSARVSDDAMAICIALIPESGPIRAMNMQGSAAYTTSDELVVNGSDSSSACFPDNLTGDRVQVRIRRGTELSAVFFTKSITLAEQGVARYEAGESP